MPAFLVRFTKLDTHRTGSMLVCSPNRTSAVSTACSTRGVLVDSVELASAARVFKSLSVHQRNLLLLVHEGASGLRPTRATRDALIQWGAIERGATGQLVMTELGEAIADIMVARRLYERIARKIQAGDPGPTTDELKAKLAELYERAQL